MPDPSRSRPKRGAAQRCDEQVPACSNCRRNNLVCLVEDPATKRHQPRNYLETLEQRVILLENMLQDARSSATSDSVPSPNGPPVANPGHASIAPVDDDRNDLGGLPSIIGTLSLNAAGAEPSYLGPSSTFAFARFIKPSLRQVVSSLSPNVSRPAADAHGAIPEPCPLPDYRAAVRLSNAYFQNIHPQYPFIHEPTFRVWEAALEDPFEGISTFAYNPVPLYFLNMVYAIGAILLPSTGYSAEQLYVSAMLYIDDILCHDNLQCIQAILCCAAYSLRSSKGISHWKLGGQALRQCVNLGYHRSQRRLRSILNPLQQEMQKRAFWSAYVMECSAAVMLGRPLSLHFREIDAEFPLDIEETYLSQTGICGSPRSSPAEPPTMMTHAIHGFRIRSLLGCIQTALYSDSTLLYPDIRKVRVQELSTDLGKWKAESPPPMIPPEGGALSYFVTPDWYETNYNYAVLQLYRIQITDTKDPAPDEIFLKCLYAAKALCHSYRRQSIGKPITYTWSALHELFLAGLTYLYCLWTSPTAREASRHDQVSSTCMDCTMVLVILAERWPDAAPYRDVFDALASRTMTMMADLQQDHNLVAPTALVPGKDTYPEQLPQWVAGIEDAGLSVGVDWLLSELIDDVPIPQQYADGGSWTG
ncbi:Positive regulator of purine utilization [Aspergillus affinis]|uniref:Positive regulator of purine utilization n=1 Tax=Aspergillus affinis TaxID=1070780 RepID=UPI0022FF2CAD|nr:Positive regulator of purine utilization [Aspergillus affinis]KAI9042021.1 Positive regulator of purine utilization [Aspergillus affinis]